MKKLILLLLPLVSFYSYNSFSSSIDYNFSSEDENIHLKITPGRYIVEFKDSNNSISSIKATHKHLFKTLNVKPIFEYFNVFNGAALYLNAEQLKIVEKSANIKKIYPDAIVEALGVKSSDYDILLKDSVSLIGADKVHNELGIKGKGIKVAVVDTGVDYTHPYLGGGFGPGFKVIGGYDFINNDSDPMDDNSHGTHVAGIIAAQAPTYTGVAPEASLLAYKVLGNGGGGNWSGVIAGIERAVIDKADVISMSLGGPGSIDDPVATATNKAVELGAVVVVAAGNSGPREETVGSPGLAKDAITVAASDKQDKIASFSSRGPVIGLDVIKPEITAPGVKILSTVPGGKEAAYSGTSMATPHISGVVALMLQNNRSLTPKDVKQILMSSALDIGGGVFSQGAGRVQAFKAMSPLSYKINRLSLNGGLFKDFANQESRAFSLTYENIENVAHDVSLAIDTTSLPNGLSISAYPERATISPHTMQNFNIEIKVNPEAKVPDNVGFMYFAFLKFTNLTNGAASIIPIVIQRSRTISVNLTKYSQTEPLVVFVGNKITKKMYRKLYPSWGEFEIPVGNGINPYWGEAAFSSDIDGDRVIIKEDLTSGSVTFDPREAIYNTIFQPRDVRGNYNSSLSWMTQYKFSFDYGQRIEINLESDEKNNVQSMNGPKFNQATNDFQLLLAARAREGNNRIYLYSFASEVGRIKRDIVFENKESVIVPVSFSKQIIPESMDVYVHLYFPFPQLPYEQIQHGGYSSDSLREIVFTPFSGQSNYAFSIRKDYYDKNGRGNGWMWQTPKMRVVDGQLEFISKNSVYERKEFDQIALGVDLPIPAIQVESINNGQPKIRITSDADVYYGAPFVFPLIHDTLTHMPSSMAAATERRAKLFRNGIFDKNLNLYFTQTYWSNEEDRELKYFDENINGVKNSIEVSTPSYLVKDELGTGTLLLTSNSSSQDTSPPKLISIERIRNGEMTEEFGGWFSKNELKLAFTDEDNSLSYAIYQGSNSGWRALDFRNLENDKISIVPKTDKSGPQNLKIVATDRSGNSMEYILSPGYIVK